MEKVISLENVEVNGFTYRVDGTSVVDFLIYSELEKVAVYVKRGNKTSLLFTYSKSKDLSDENLIDFIRRELKRKFFVDPFK